MEWLPTVLLMLNPQRVRRTVWRSPANGRPRPIVGCNGLFDSDNATAELILPTNYCPSILPSRLCGLRSCASPLPKSQ